MGSQGRFGWPGERIRRPLMAPAQMSGCLADEPSESIGQARSCFGGRLQQPVSPSDRRSCSRRAVRQSCVHGEFGRDSDLHRPARTSDAQVVGWRPHLSRPREFDPSMDSPSLATVEAHPALRLRGSARRSDRGRDPRRHTFRSALSRHGRLPRLGSDRDDGRDHGRRDRDVLESEIGEPDLDLHSRPRRLHCSRRPRRTPLSHTCDSVVHLHVCAHRRGGLSVGLFPETLSRRVSGGIRASDCGVVARRFRGRFPRLAVGVRHQRPVLPHLGTSRRGRRYDGGRVAATHLRTTPHQTPDRIESGGACGRGPDNRQTRIECSLPGHCRAGACRR